MHAHGAHDLIFVPVHLFIAAAAAIAAAITITYRPLIALSV